MQQLRLPNRKTVEFYAKEARGSPRLTAEIFEPDRTKSTETGKKECVLLISGWTSHTAPFGQLAVQ